MRAARSKDCRVIPYHAATLKFDGAVALRRQILKFVYGIRGPRKNPVTRKQIVEWFRATDPAFVEKQIDFLSDSLMIRGCANSLGSHRRFNGRYVYEMTEAGERELGITREVSEHHGQELAGISSLGDASEGREAMTDTATIPEYEWGGHAFVWARPRDRNWDKFDATNGLGSGPREFRPCMVTGHDAGQSIRVLGSQYGFPLDQFEIAGECKPPAELGPAADLEPLPNSPFR